MSDLTLRDRRLVLDRLAVLAGELGSISTWLSLQDEDRAGIRAECASRDLEAACWQLSVPLRLPLSVGPDGQQRATGG